MSKQYVRLDKEKAVCLLVDHQTGLFSLVQDFAPSEFKNNVLALADCAKFFGLPTVLTTSLESGPNGPLLPEIRKMFPDAPFVARPGQINAWDNEEFVAAVGKTGRKQLLIAGIVTDVCVSFLTLLFVPRRRLPSGRFVFLGPCACHGLVLRHGVPYDTNRGTQRAGVFRGRSVRRDCRGYRTERHDGR